MKTKIEINGEVKEFIRIIRYLDGRIIGYTVGRKEIINLTVLTICPDFGAKKKN